MTTTGKSVVAWKDRLLPTTTAHHSRLQIFQATRHPTFCTREIHTPWGSGTITGRLGTMHHLLLEICLFRCERVREIESGAQQLLVDPYRVRRGMTGDKGQYSAAGIKALAADLRAATFQLDLRGGGWLVDGIIDRITESPKRRYDPLTRRERPLARVDITPTYRAFLAADLPLHYDPTPLGALRHGISQAIARLALSHRDQPHGGWSLDHLIQAVGAETEGAAGRKRRFEIRADRDGLAALGLEVAGDKIVRVLSTPGGVLPTPGAFSPRPIAFSPRPVR